MPNDTEDFVAILEYQLGKNPERLVRLIRNHVGKPLSPLLADFLATLLSALLQKKSGAKRGHPKMRLEARDLGIAHAVARYRQKEQRTREDAVLQVAEDTGLSEATIKRAIARYSSKVRGSQIPLNS